MRLVLPVALVVLTALAADTLRARAAQRWQATQQYEAHYYVPDRAVLPPLSLGYRRALADLLWMRALIYTGDEYQHRGSIEHVFRYTEAMLELDPDFRAVYGWVGVAGLYRPQEVSRADIEQVLAIQRRGLERFPHDGTLLWDVAGNLKFELRPRLVRAGEDEAVERLDREAADLFLESAARGAAPPWVVLSSARTLDDLGAREHAIDRLEQMYVLVDDPSTRDAIGARLTELRGEQANAELAADLQRLEREHAQYPWVPLDFFGLVRPTLAEAAALGSDAPGALMDEPSDDMLSGSDEATTDAGD